MVLSIAAERSSVVFNEHEGPIWLADGRRFGVRIPTRRPLLRMEYPPNANFACGYVPKVIRRETRTPTNR